MSAGLRIRTVIVDDSAVARQLLHWTLTQAGDFEVIETVGDGERALERVEALRPDLVTMDLHLPGMNGLEVTRRIMRGTPTPIAIVAASANLNDATIFEALEAGALAAVQRPLAPGQPDYLRRRRRLLGELRAIGRSSLATGMSRTRQAAGQVSGRRHGPVAKALLPAAPTSDRRPVELIAVGASTGGPQALRSLLSGLPRAELPPLLVVQHMAEGFVAGLAAWLASDGRGPVRVATDGQRLATGTILIAPDGRHLTATRDGRVRLLASAPVGGHRPSANVLFESVAAAYGAHGVGIILTGMGRDGADGLLRLHEAGGHTLAEDPATAVVGGMPGAAIALGAIDHVLPLPAIAPAIVRMLSRRPSRARPDLSEGSIA